MHQRSIDAPTVLRLQLTCEALLMLKTCQAGAYIYMSWGFRPRSWFNVAIARDGWVELQRSVHFEVQKAWWVHRELPAKMNKCEVSIFVSAWPGQEKNLPQSIFRSMTTDWLLWIASLHSRSYLWKLSDMKHIGGLSSESQSILDFGSKQGPVILNAIKQKTDTMDPFDMV